MGGGAARDYRNVSRETLAELLDLLPGDLMDYENDVDLFPERLLKKIEDWLKVKIESCQFGYYHVVDTSGQ